MNSSPAAERNREPIAAELRRIFASARVVVEVGCGTGQHAVYFAGQLPHLTWIPTNGPGGLDDARARVEQASLANLRDPVAFDLFDAACPVDAADAFYAANVLHIAPWPATVRLFTHADAVLDDSGCVVVYGPFRYASRPLEPSNAAFDAQLRSGDPQRGIRAIDDVTDAARAHGFSLIADIEMPANNRLLHFVRSAP